MDNKPVHFHLLYFYDYPDAEQNWEIDGQKTEYTHIISGNPYMTFTSQIIFSDLHQ